MNLLRSRALWGILLVLGGVALLLQNLVVFTIGGLVWGLIFLVGGLVFLTEYFANRANWWTVIPGVSLCGIGITILLGEIFPRLGDLFGGLIILGGIGLSFLIIYFAHRDQWWAIIPGGVLAVLAVISVLDQANLEIDTGGLFLLGIGLVFLVVGFLPTQQGQMRWAFIPAVVLLVLGAAIIAATAEAFNYIWPVLIILGGVLLAVRALLSSRGKA